MSNQVGGCFKFLWPFKNFKEKKSKFSDSLTTLVNESLENITHNFFFESEFKIFLGPIVNYGYFTDNWRQK